MTCMVNNNEHQEQVETAIQNLATRIRLELNLNNPEYEATMESNEAFSRISHLLMAVCELYELKEQLWDEVSKLSGTLTEEANEVLEARHKPINETIYTRFTEINYLSQFLNEEQGRIIDGYVDQIRPYLDKCVPRSSILSQPIGGGHEDPQQWYIPKRSQFSAVVTTADEVIAVTKETWGDGEHKERRTRSPKFA